MTDRRGESNGLRPNDNRHFMAPPGCMIIGRHPDLSSTWRKAVWESIPT